VFLLKLIRPEFSHIVEEQEILKLVLEVVEALENVSIDEEHTPFLYASFLRVLVENRRSCGNGSISSVSGSRHRSLSEGDNGEGVGMSIGTTGVPLSNLDGRNDWQDGNNGKMDVDGLNGNAIGAPGFQLQPQQPFGHANDGFGNNNVLGSGLTNSGNSINGNVLIPPGVGADWQNLAVDNLLESQCTLKSWIPFVSNVLMFGSSSIAFWDSFLLPGFQGTMGLSAGGLHDGFESNWSSLPNGGSNIEGSGFPSGSGFGNQFVNNGFNTMSAPGNYDNTGGGMRF
jgi:hypothetical protein